MPVSTLSEQAAPMVEHFENNNMLNCALLVEVLDAHPEIIALAYIDFTFTPEAIGSFKTEAHYWLAQGLFSSALVLGVPGHERPLQTIKTLISLRSISDHESFWKNIENIAAPSLYTRIGKGITIEDNKCTLLVSETAKI